jgi:hypothetical protein
MAVPSDEARMIQRVIDDKYPNTRRLWQSFQHQPAPRQTYAPFGPLTFTRSPTLSASGSGRVVPATLDKAVQRVIDFRYPEARQVWLRAREEPEYAQSVRRARGSGGLPTLNDSNRPKTTTPP